MATGRGRPIWPQRDPLFDDMSRPVNQVVPQIPSLGYPQLDGMPRPLIQNGPLSQHHGFPPVHEVVGQFSQMSLQVPHYGYPPFDQVARLPGQMVPPSQPWGFPPFDQMARPYGHMNLPGYYSNFLPFDGAARPFCQMVPPSHTYAFIQFDGTASQPGQVSPPDHHPEFPQLDELVKKFSQMGSQEQHHAQPQQGGSKRQRRRNRKMSQESKLESHRNGQGEKRGKHATGQSRSTEKQQDVKPKKILQRKKAEDFNDLESLKKILPPFAFELEMDEVVPEPTEDVLKRLEVAYDRFMQEKELMGLEPYLEPEVHRIMEEMNLDLDGKELVSEENKENEEPINYKKFFLSLGKEQASSSAKPGLKKPHLTAKEAEELWQSIGKRLLEQEKMFKECHEKIQSLENRLQEWSGSSKKKTPSA